MFLPLLLPVCSRSCRCCKRIPRGLVANALIMRWHLNASNPWSNAGGSRDRFSQPDVNLRRRLLENTPPRWIRADRVSCARLLKNLVSHGRNRDWGCVIYPGRHGGTLFSVRKNWLKLWDWNIDAWRERKKRNDSRYWFHFERKFNKEKFISYSEDGRILNVYNI